MDDCIFCKLANGDIPTDMVYQDDKIAVFRDASPQAPVHMLMVPRCHVASLDDLTDKIIAAQSTSLQEAQASRHLTAYAEFRRLSSVQDVYDMIVSGKADAGFVDMETAQNYIENNPDAGLMLIEGLCFSLEEYELGDRICAKKGEQQLICFVNGVIDEVLNDGSYVKWIEEAEKRAAELGL